MNKLKLILAGLISRRRWTTVLLLVGVSLLVVTAVSAAVPGDRAIPHGTVPNPGTQQQELANITFPAPYNVFEFVVTCGACHGGTVDQQAGHFGNWAGTSMASAARDPIFRANQIGIEYATGRQGAGNICFRCHSPNGWLSGRFDPTLAGSAEGRSMIHSIVLSTDDEGIMCEFCHRSIGNVTFKRSDLDPTDPVWNMMSGILDWPHEGLPYLDQAGDPEIAEGNPYGDATMQINDGMTYIGKYSGSVDIFASDTPLPGTTYTGQTYGVYPPGFPNAGEPVVSPDGSTPIHFELPIGPPLVNGIPDYEAQSISLEHPTVGGRDGEEPDANTFINSSEFCGTCHDLTIPIMNHGMPEQRTYTEWKYSDFGTDNVRCQDCHMPTQKHEYSDDAAVSLNADPVISGWFPYAKDRNQEGGTAFHKFAGANRDLPMMMKELYPEPDLEVIGAPTGNDTTIFPGMLSTRDPMYDRAQRNTEIMLLDAVDVEIVDGPVYDPVTNRWTVQVKVTNKSGHRIPSGYPDGRRFWIDLQVTDSNGAVVYESGFYDQDLAMLFNDSGMNGFQRAIEPSIDSRENAVMVYERVTCTDDANGACVPSPNLLNNKILFDNRILAVGFDYDQLRLAGVKFWNYDPVTMMPYEDTDRYAEGQNWDVVTYTFDAPEGTALNARAEVYWQTHTREFMEHLKDQDTSDYRPEGSPDILDPNYPLNPTYLSDVINLQGVEQEFGINLNDNWGGIAYASWLKTGKGAPYLVAVADQIASVPTAPTGLMISTVANPETGLNDPFSQLLTWDPVDGADGYEVWTLYGASEATADWDKLGIVQAPTTELFNTALNVNKTYVYQVRAFNGAGYGPYSEVAVGKTTNTLPLSPEALTFVSSTDVSITMSWFDASDNEVGWIVSRQDVPPLANFVEIARFDSTTVNGGVPFTDGDNNPNVAWAAGYVAPQPSKCYNYVVESYNLDGTSGWNVNGPVQMCTGAAPGAPTNLTAAVGISTQVSLNWSSAIGTIDGYRIERSSNGGATWTSFTLPDPLAVSYTDTTSLAGTTYQYRVLAYNAYGDSLYSNVASVTTPTAPPAAPTNLRATTVLGSQVNLAWKDNSNNENGFRIERSDDGGLTWVQIGQVARNRTLYSDTTVEPKFTYKYRVYAYRTNNRGVSDYSNVITVVTPGEVPQPPTRLRLLSKSANSITVRWNDNSTNETGFTLEWSTDGLNWLTEPDLPANTTSYTLSGLEAYTRYYFRVQAFNVDGVSPYSNVFNTVTRRR